MGRDIRYLPAPHTLTEVTVRTIQQRYLLRPGPQLNQLIIGVLAHAQDAIGIRLHAAVAMSSHFHLLVSPTSTQQVARFMCLVTGNLSKEAGRLHHWTGTVFPRRATQSDRPGFSDRSPAALARRLRTGRSTVIRRRLVPTPHRPNRKNGQDSSRLIGQEWCDADPTRIAAAAACATGSQRW